MGAGGERARRWVRAHGRAAPPGFVRRLTHIAFNHDERIVKVDTVRAYHFGPRFLVEVEIVMQPDTPLHESHDVGIMLQHKIERLDQVPDALGGGSAGDPLGDAGDPLD